MKKVKERIEQAIHGYHPSEVLIAWDIDFTLILPSKREAQTPNITKNQATFDALTKDMTRLHIELVYNLIGARCNKDHEKDLTESHVPEIVRFFQGKNIKNIALTAAMPGAFGPIEKIEAWRYKTLKNLGIDFSLAFSQGNMEFTQLPAYFHRYPLFFNGILYSNGEASPTDKGYVLTHFLQQTSYIPKIVVLVDDREKNLEDVKKALDAHQPRINFLGIHYTQAHLLHSGHVTPEEFKEYWHPIIQESKRLIKEVDKKPSDGSI